MRAKSSPAAMRRGMRSRGTAPRRKGVAPGDEEVREPRGEMALLVGVLRVLSGYTQTKMAKAAGIHASTLSRYEEGRAVPPRDTLERLAAAARVPMWKVDGVLLPVIGLVRSDGDSLAGRAESGPDPRQDIAAIEKGIGAVACLAVADFLAEGAGSEDASTELTERWRGELASPATAEATTSNAGAGDRRQREAFERFCARLCDESVKAAANDARRALALARLALSLADLVPGQPAWCHRMAGSAWGFIANAQRVGGDLPAADTSFDAAWRQRQAGAAAGEGIAALGTWRLLDLEASLRREQRQFEAALELLSKALVGAPTESKGRILLKRAVTLEQAGRIDEAVATLREAAPLVEAAAEPRERWVLRFNLLVNLCHLGSHEDAEAELPALQVLTRELANDLDLLRVQWLSGRIATGRGRNEEARGAFEQLIRDFSRLDNAYDTALVSLDLALLHLEAGETAEVRVLAAKMVWIFGAQRVHREALAALTLFCKAAESETATVELVRHVLDYLERARRDPELRFEDTD